MSRSMESSVGRYQIHDVKIANISDNMKTENIIKLMQPEVTIFRAVTMNMKLD